MVWFWDTSAKSSSAPQRVASFCVSARAWKSGALSHLGVPPSACARRLPGSRTASTNHCQNTPGHKRAKTLRPSPSNCLFSNQPRSDGNGSLATVDGQFGPTRVRSATPHSAVKLLSTSCKIWLTCLAHANSGALSAHANLPKASRDARVGAADAEALFEHKVELMHASSGTAACLKCENNDASHASRIQRQKE